MLRSNKRDLYIVPVLPIKEIIDYYAEIDIQIRPSDIMKPTTTSTLKLFDTLLELYKGERTSDLLLKHRSESDFAEFEDSLYFFNYLETHFFSFANSSINSLIQLSLIIPVHRKVYDYTEDADKPLWFGLCYIF